MPKPTPTSSKDTNSKDKTDQDTLKATAGGMPGMGTILKTVGAAAAVTFLAADAALRGDTKAVSLRGSVEPKALDALEVGIHNADSTLAIPEESRFARDLHAGTTAGFQGGVLLPQHNTQYELPKDGYGQPIPLVNGQFGLSLAKVSTPVEIMFGDPDSYNIVVTMYPKPAKIKTAAEQAAEGISLPGNHYNGVTARASTGTGQEIWFGDVAPFLATSASGLRSGKDEAAGMVISYSPPEAPDLEGKKYPFKDFGIWAPIVGSTDIVESMVTAFDYNPNTDPGGFPFNRQDISWMGQFDSSDMQLPKLGLPKDFFTKISPVARIKAPGAVAILQPDGAFAPVFKKALAQSTHAPTTPTKTPPRHKHG